MDRGHRNVRHADGVSARLPDNQCDHRALSQDVRNLDHVGVRG